MPGRQAGFLLDLPGEVVDGRGEPENEMRLARQIGAVFERGGWNLGQRKR